MRWLSLLLAILTITCGAALWYACSCILTCKLSVSFLAREPRPLLASCRYSLTCKQSPPSTRKLALLGLAVDPRRNPPWIAVIVITLHQ